MTSRRIVGVRGTDARPKDSDRTCMNEGCETVLSRYNILEFCARCEKISVESPRRVRRRVTPEA